MVQNLIIKNLFLKKYLLTSFVSQRPLDRSSSVRLTLIEFAAPSIYRYTNAYIPRGANIGIR